VNKEVLDIVDENGVVIGRASRGEMYRTGLAHPAVNVLLFNSKHQIFIQKRVANKDAFPNFWDISVAEHLKSDESFRDGAVRGLLEELSVDGSDVILLRGKHLQRSEFVVGRKKIRENELVELYGITYDGEIVVNHEEVFKGRFVNISALWQFGEKDFTPWGLDEIGFLLRQG
jgi:isopentenyldiphosphate isomerase